MLGEIVQGQIDKGVLYDTFNPGAICRYVHPSMANRFPAYSPFFPVTVSTDRD